MKHLILIAAVFTAFAFTACGKSKKGGGGDVATPPGPASAPPTYAHGCQLGQVFAQQYGCLNRGGCNPGFGFVQNEQRCVQGEVVTDGNQSYAGRWGYSLVAINSDAFERFLQEQGGFCNQWTFNWGNANCDKYSGSGYIIIQALNGFDLNVTIGAGRSTPDYADPYAWYTYTPYHTVQLSAKVFPINGDAGFEFRGSRPFVGAPSFNPSGDMLLRGLVEQGRLGDKSFKVDLYYRGVKFAEAPVEAY